jgi:hypothetical protein
MQDSLDTLADRARGGDHAAGRFLREELEVDLVRLVRCALRRGTGLPAVVRWARGQFADLADAPGRLDERQAAPVLARLLCHGVVNNLTAGGAQQTVCGG